MRALLERLTERVHRVQCCGHSHTHRPDIIDPALQRIGRLEKTIVLCVPEYRVRTDIVTRQIEDINLDFVLSVLQCQDKGGNIHFVTNERAGMSAMEVIATC